ncbi:MAG: RsmE family RNA methyltransferase [Pseudomonadales bacterium]|nr:RsmE family RNA methyltransferase [Pseudomonadales bacterium]
MPNHLYVDVPDGELNVGTNLALNRDQHHYLTRVLRLRSGDTCDCFDGQGLKFKAVLDSSSRDAKLTVTIVEPREAPASHRNHLAMALLKGSAMDRAIQLACESGAHDISLFSAQRSNAKLDAKRFENKREHWQKIIIGACEQSGRAYLPTFDPDVSLEALLASDTNTYVLHMDGGPFNFQIGADRLMLVGPEGGWSEAELSLMESARVQRVSVGPTTLRAESTPGAALAILNYLDGTGG